MELPGDATSRFTERADDYSRWRPGYPAGVVEFWSDVFGWKSGDCLIDLGAGTGIMSGMLLDAGFGVMAVEPNEAMRQAAEDVYGKSPGFRSARVPAERTGLPDGSARGAVAAQAFHWFEPEAVRDELRRVLEPPHHVGIVWNVRRTDSSPFLEAYEAFLHEWGTDYAAVQARQANPEASLNALFEGEPSASREFVYEQRFGYDGLEGRLMSCSYVPDRSAAAFEPMMRALRNMFERYARGGEVVFEYDTRAYGGALAS